MSSLTKTQVIHTANPVPKSGRLPCSSLAHSSSPALPPCVPFQKTDTLCVHNCKLMIRQAFLPRLLSWGGYAAGGGVEQQQYDIPIIHCMSLECTLTAGTQSSTLRLRRSRACSSFGSMALCASPMWSTSRSAWRNTRYAACHAVTTSFLSPLPILSVVPL